MNATGYIVTLETRNFSFEAHGETEEQANEAMGRALTAHERHYHLETDWWAEYEFQTRPFIPGSATRDGENIAPSVAARESAIVAAIARSRMATGIATRAAPAQAAAAERAIRLVATDIAATLGFDHAAFMAACGFR